MEPDWAWIIGAGAGIAAVAGTVTGVLAHRYTLAAEARRRIERERDRAEKDAREKGAEAERLKNVIEDVSRIATIELPEIKTLTHENAVAVAGLIATTQLQGRNIDDLRELQVERMSRIGDLIEEAFRRKG